MPVKERPAYAHSEAQLETLFRVRVHGIGGLVTKLAPTVAGVPDRMVILPGQPGWPARIYLVELKTVTGRLSPIQVEWHRRAAALNVRVAVLHGLAEIDRWCRERATEYDHLLDII